MSRWARAIPLIVGGLFTVLKREDGGLKPTRAEVYEVPQRPVVASRLVRGEFVLAGREQHPPYLPPSSAM